MREPNQDWIMFFCAAIAGQASKNIDPRDIADRAAKVADAAADEYVKRIPQAPPFEETK